MTTHDTSQKDQTVEGKGRFWDRKVGMIVVYRSPSQSFDDGVVGSPQTRRGPGGYDHT